MSSTDSPVEVTREGPVAFVRLNRPDQLNAAADDLIDMLTQVWEDIVDDPGIGAVVLTGNGRAFSAGGDLTEMLELANSAPAELAALRESLMRRTRRLFRAMLDFPLPIVAAVNGPAVGFGSSLVLSSDIVLMAERAYLSDPHVMIGLAAGDGGAALMPLHVGMLRAKEYLFLGDRIGADQAVSLGLASRTTPDDELLDEATALARRLCALPRAALLSTKRALNAHVEHAVAGPLDIGLEAEGATFGSPDHVAAVERILKHTAVKRAADRAGEEKS